MNARSPLEVVAEHEQQLMQQIAEAEEESQRLLEAARAQAAQVRRVEGEQLLEEVARRRKEASESRSRLIQDIEGRAAEEVERIRRETSGRIPSVHKELVAMIVPAREEGVVQ